MDTIYLHDIPLSEARRRLESALREAGLSGVLGKEVILLDEMAVGRVLAEPVWAKISSPHYHASAMDGFALRAADTAAAQLNKPLVLTCIGGAPASDDNLLQQDRSKVPTVYIDTGDPLPDWADAVVPIEQVEALNDDDSLAINPRKPAKIAIRAALTPWQHVRSLGEDLIATQLVLPAGHVLRPVDLGAIAASGNATIVVARKPRVAVIPTGSELVKVGAHVSPGDIIEFNSMVLAGQVNEWGGVATRFSIVPDVFEEIRRQVQNAAVGHDLILLNAGSSAGSEDFSARVVESLGELLVHGIAVRPGHPVILGMLGKEVLEGSDSDRDNSLSASASVKNAPVRQVLLIGIPGYPVSAALTGEIFVEPLLARWTGRSAWQPGKLNAILTRKLTSPSGDDDYIRVVAAKVGSRMLAAPLARGSGVITSLVRADGIVIIPAGSQGLPAGAKVEVRLYRSPEEIERSILAIGSHDMVLDMVGQFLSSRDRRLVSANVGSQGGLIALQRGECHLAGSHLLDPATGSYNLPYIREYLPGVPVFLVDFVERQQGLIVLPGNPLNIKSLEDLTRPGIRFVNRQRGAGTRVLLDYHLNQQGISSHSIQGYNKEEYTHLAVAAAVASGRFDAGLGIAAAANALELDFIPLFSENYQLVIPAEHYNDVLLQPLLELISSVEFQAQVALLPGYDSSKMGRIASVIQ